MTTISIKDLPESVVLDREAMLAITGGARSGGSQHFSGRPGPGTNRVSGYPAGFSAFAMPEVGALPGASQHFK
ncbi:MAG: hypothetical protein HYU74_01230 [Dechloromonas sp.]|nr:hypothetical protein [Dechloromonas sp.]